METQYVAKRAYGIRVPTGFFIFHGHDPKIDYHCGRDGFIIPEHEGHEKQLERFMDNQSADFRVETTEVFVRDQTPDGVKHLGWVRPKVAEPIAVSDAALEMASAMSEEPTREQLRDLEDEAGRESAREMTAMAQEPPAAPPKPPKKKGKAKKGGK